MTRAIPDANAKLRRLCSMASQMGGALVTFAAVARAMELAPSRVTQMFGVNGATAEKGLSPENLGRLISVFHADGVALRMDDLFLPYDEFATRLDAAQQTAPPLRGLLNVRQEPPGHRWVLQGDQLGLDPAGEDTDAMAAADPVFRQLHEAARRHAEKFCSLAERVDNVPAWDGIADAARRLNEQLRTET